MVQNAFGKLERVKVGGRGRRPARGGGLAGLGAIRRGGPNAAGLARARFWRLSQRKLILASKTNTQTKINFMAAIHR